MLAKFRVLKKLILKRLQKGWFLLLKCCCLRCILKLIIRNWQKKNSEYICEVSNYQWKGFTVFETQGFNVKKILFTLNVMLLRNCPLFTGIISIASSLRLLLHQHRSYHHFIFDTFPLLVKHFNHHNLSVSSCQNVLWGEEEHEDNEQGKAGVCSYARTAACRRTRTQTHFRKRGQNILEIKLRTIPQSSRRSWENETDNWQNKFKSLLNMLLIHKKQPFAGWQEVVLLQDV